MENKRIKLSLPHLGGTEQEWVNKAFDGDWVVPLGPNVDEFERRLEQYLGASHVVALSAGTAAIHLGLVGLGVSKGDEVICQSLTFSASANPICYQGASPVFVDSETDTWNMSPDWLEKAIIDRKKVTGRFPRAIIPVHLYGMPAKMKEIMAIASHYSIPVLEDAAEALGSEYCGTHCGTLGKYGALSFNGNKVITTSGGGALICPSADAASEIKFYATQARENRPYYYHEKIGFNYRLSNLSAGLGCGQMDVLTEHVERRRHIHSMYAEALDSSVPVSVMNNPSPEFNSNFWLTTIQLHDDSPLTPDQLRIALDSDNIETRLIWRPMHMQPVFADAPYYGEGISDRIFEQGLCLPSGSAMSDNDIERVIDSIRKHLK